MSEVTLGGAAGGLESVGFVVGFRAAGLIATLGVAKTAPKLVLLLFCDLKMDFALPREFSDLYRWLVGL